jgi:hypothetical protein
MTCVIGIWKSEEYSNKKEAARMPGNFQYAVIGKVL